MKKILFNKESLANLIQQKRSDFCNEVDKWEPRKILDLSAHELVDNLSDKFLLSPPRIRPEEYSICDWGASKIDLADVEASVVLPPPPELDNNQNRFVLGKFVDYAIPYDGDAQLFECCARTRDYCLEQIPARIEDTSIIIRIQKDESNQDHIESKFKEVIYQMQHILKWVQNDCENWNTEFPNFAKDYIENRRQRLLELERNGRFTRHTT